MEDTNVGSPKRRRMASVVALLLAVAAGSLVYFRYHAVDDGVPGSLVLYGNVDIRQVDLAFNVDGRVEAMLAEEGDSVEAGQLLARLDDSRYQDAAAAARATAASYRAVVARLEAGTRSEEIEKARADVRAAEGTWKAAQAQVERQKALARDRFASQQALDDAIATEQAARGNLDSLRQVLALAVAGPRKEDIAEAKANLGTAEANLAVAEHRLADTSLEASTDGIVLTRIQEPGAVILANTPVYTVALADPLWVRTYVSEPDLARVYPGMKAEVATDAASGQVYQGWVGFISPTAEFTPKTVQTPDIRTSLVYRLRVYVHNPDGGLRQGMPVTVRLLEEDGEGAAKENAAAGDQ